MTITFFANFMNHHQLPLSLELIKLLGDGNYHFVAFEQIHAERSKMGYEDMNAKYPFIIRAYASDEEWQKALEFCRTSDIAIIGNAPAEFRDIRYNSNKLTYLYRERLFKNGTWHRFYPPTALKLYKDYTKVRNRNVYLLAASAYASFDLQLCGFKKEKCFKWGYFPELLPQVKKNFDKLRIMWCGRMLWWKHPEDAVEVALYLRSKKILFEMQIIGDGEKKEFITKMVHENNLEDSVFLYNFMSPSDIRNVMNESNVYLFTSGKQEGWGVVLTEAMNSSCVVIANKNAGSTPFLVDNNSNGFIYDGTISSLHTAVDALLKCDMEALSTSAYYTIVNTWAPNVAAENLVVTSRHLLEGGKNHVLNGPCSLVE